MQYKLNSIVDDHNVRPNSSQRNTLIKSPLPPKQSRKDEKTRITMHPNQKFDLQFLLRMGKSRSNPLVPKTYIQHTLPYIKSPEKKQSKLSANPFHSPVKLEHQRMLRQLVLMQPKQIVVHQEFKFDQSEIRINSNIQQPFIQGRKIVRSLERVQTKSIDRSHSPIRPQINQSQLKRRSSNQQQNSPEIKKEFTMTVSKEELVRQLSKYKQVIQDASLQAQQDPDELNKQLNMSAIREQDEDNQSKQSTFYRQKF